MEDHIHCFKAGQPCEAGRSELLTAMEEMIARRNQDDEDPFASDVDKEKTEENEDCVDSDESGTGDDSGTTSDEEQ